MRSPSCGIRGPRAPPKNCFPGRPHVLCICSLNSEQALLQMLLLARFVLGLFFFSCCHSLALAQIHHLEFASRSKNTTRVQMTFSCLERGRQRRPQLNKTRWLEIRGQTRRLLLPRREALMPRRNNLHQKIQWKFENYVTFSAASRSSETSQKRLLSAAVLKRCFSRRLRSRQCFRL